MCAATGYLSRNHRQSLNWFHCQCNHNGNRKHSYTTEGQLECPCPAWYIIMLIRRSAMSQSMSSSCKQCEHLFKTTDRFSESSSGCPMRTVTCFTPSHRLAETHENTIEAQPGCHGCGKLLVVGTAPNILSPHAKSSTGDQYDT
jgi:hypothetical protein